MQSVTQSRQRSKDDGGRSGKALSPASKMDQLKEAFMMGLISKSEYVNMGVLYQKKRSRRMAK